MALLLHNIDKSRSSKKACVKHAFFYMLKNDHQKNRKFFPIPLILALIALILLTRPYTGIRHDSILYFGQAFSEIYPEEFKEDIFFKYGSQASFTLSHQIIVLLLKRFSPEIVSITLVILGQVAFWVASIFAAKRILENKNISLISVIFVVSMPGIYGAFNIFSYAEPFYTGRTFSEPAVLIAIACAISGAWYVSAAFLFLACIMHPLIAAPALIFLWIWGCFVNRKFLCLILVVPIFGACLYLLAPDLSSKIFQRYDDDWWSWIQEANKNVFLKNWPIQTWAQLFIDVSILVIAIRRKIFSSDILGKSVLIAGVICFVTSFIFSDIFKFVYAAGLQLWRIHWILHWMALIVTPSILLMHWEQRKNPGGLIKGFLILSVVLLGAPTGAYTSSLAAIFIIPLYFIWDNIKISDFISKLIVVVISVALFLNFSRFGFDFYARNINSDNQLVDIFLGVLLYPIVISFFSVLLFLIYIRNNKVAQSSIILLITFISLLGIFVGLQHWDRRNEFTNFVEKNGNSNINPFHVNFEKGKQVYWDHSLLAPWVLLNRASYWSDFQAAGLLFNRGTAEAGYERSQKFKKINFQTQLCNIMNMASNSQNTCIPDAELVIELCQNSNNLLRYMVFGQHLNLHSVSSWVSSAYNKEIEYYLYDCNNL